MEPRNSNVGNTFRFSAVKSKGVELLTADVFQCKQTADAFSFSTLVEHLQFRPFSHKSGLHFHSLRAGELHIRPIQSPTKYQFKSPAQANFPEKVFFYENFPEKFPAVRQQTTTFGHQQSPVLQHRNQSTGARWLHVKK